VVGHVVESGEARLINDVERDPYFSDELDQEIGGVSPEAILCVPLVIHNRVIGAIELVNNLDGQFNEQDLALLNAMAASVAVAVDNANLYAELNDFAEELERSQAQLVQAEKMAAIGRLAASLAHEINNPLQAIHNTLHLSSQAALGSEKRLRYLNMAQDEVQKLIEIVQRMLDFYRPSRGDAGPTEINEVIERVLALARKRLRHSNVEVHTDLSDDLPTLSLVADQISQVFLNLVINAIEAMPDGGDLWLETALSADEDEIVITFRDSGIGMSSEEIASLFEPFYTTKVDGTGLGLAISYGIIERHRGVIEVSSRPGVGSTFVVRLPV
jgi:two-component system NtrC family sensor kinase